MTTISNATNSQLSTAIGGAGAKDVTFDTFLKLLVAQLKNQDPLNPMEGTEFTSQIAQFSALEQQINTNTYLSNLVEQRDYAQQTVAASYIGKEVLGAGDEVTKSGEGAIQFGYSVEKGAAAVEISIVQNASGKVVQTIKGDPKEGSHMLEWDGKDDDGNVLADGEYTIMVKARNADDDVVTSTALVYGKVVSALNDQGNASVMTADGRQIAISDVLAVREPKATQTASN